VHAIPASASILVHFDVDVLADAEFPVACFPHSEGLTMEEIAELLGPVVRDSCVRIVETSGYWALRDISRVWVQQLAAMLPAALSPRS
jgi:arginase family enzyme